jgi:AcrR family transcriptional regulator
MSRDTSPEVVARPRRARSAQGRAELRRALAAAAVDLFTAQGYEETTVDDIAAAAGVGRRTFFRYFRSKEEAISPDHDGALARAAAVLEQAHPREPTASLVLRAGETVLDMYTNEPTVSLQRFRLVQEVAALRDQEAASVDRYRRLFTRHLRRRFADDPDGEMRAAVTAAAVVAAHNVALRAWLASGAAASEVAACRERFRRVAGLLPGEPAPDDGELRAVALRLEAAVGRLERGADRRDPRAAPSGARAELDGLGPGGHG